MINVGKIVAAHGIKGEVKVLSLSSNPHRFKKGSILKNEKNGEDFVIASLRQHKNDYIIHFKDIDDRNKAEALRGIYLQISEEDVPPLPQGEYYYFQLEGLLVEDEDGNALGILTDFLQSGANDVYRVAMENGDILMLPALKQVVKKIDLENKKMTVALIPGLMEACIYHED